MTVTLKELSDIVDFGKTISGLLEWEEYTLAATLLELDIGIPKAPFYAEIVMKLTMKVDELSDKYPQTSEVVKELIGYYRSKCSYLQK